MYITTVKSKPIHHLPKLLVLLCNPSSFSRIYVNRITKYIIFWGCWLLWFLTLLIIILIVHAVRCNNSLFLFITEQYSIVLTTTCLSSHLMTDI